MFAAAARGPGRRSHRVTEPVPRRPGADSHRLSTTMPAVDPMKAPVTAPGECSNPQYANKGNAEKQGGADDITPEPGRLDGFVAASLPHDLHQPEDRAR